MDEQHDQAVLETIETDADYDYLSILREMQDSLSADQESSIIPDPADNNSETTIDKVFDAQIPENELHPFLSEPFSVNSDSVNLAEADLQAEDYLANAKTQPLPELPADFNSDSKLEQRGDDKPGETVSNNSSVVPADTSANSETTELSATETGNLEPPSFPQNGLAVQFHDHSFADFAEMSPILFDSNERFDIVEPSFEADFSGEATVEATPEMTVETFSENAPANVAETTINELAGMTDEMPTNLAFGEMFAEESKEPSAAFVVEAPSIEIDEETEAEFTTLLAGLEELDSDNSALPTARLDELVQPVAITSSEDYERQDFRAEDLTESAANEPESSNTLAVSSDDALDFGLPEAMLLKENIDNLAPEPVFAALDEELETTFETIEESLPDAQTKNFETPILAVPSFLQAELDFAKQPAVSENLPTSLPTLETTAESTFDAVSQEDAASELRSLAHEILRAAPPLRSADDTAAPQQTSNTAEELLLADFTVADKVQETPEPVLIETTATGAEEINYSNDFAQDNSVSLLANEFEDALPDLSTEMPESLLLDTFETELPEVDFAEFDLQPPVAANQSYSAVTVLADSKQNSAASGLLQEMSDLPKSASFLKERFVIFKLDDTLYAFPAVNVAEIGQLLPITPLPFVPSWFLGISNLRGDILSVIGLRELWEKNAAPPHKAKILVVRSEKQALTVGLVVDAVREMRHVAPEEIFSDDSNTESHFAPYQIGMVEYEGQNLCLLNAEKLLETLRS